jgi:hypothetical protein
MSFMQHVKIFKDSKIKLHPERLFGHILLPLPWLDVIAYISSNS